MKREVITQYIVMSYEVKIDSSTSIFNLSFIVYKLNISSTRCQQEYFLYNSHSINNLALKAVVRLKDDEDSCQGSRIKRTYNYST